MAVTATGRRLGQRVLIADEDARFAEFLQESFEANGFRASVAHTGANVIDLARDGDYELVLLGLALPQRDGLEALGEIRSHGQRVPVIVVTANDEVENAVEGLVRGADDYMTKPCKFDELLARAQLRISQAAVHERNLIAGQMTLDLDRRTVSIGDKVESLSPRQFALAEVFFRHPGQVLTREHLMRVVWGTAVPRTSKSLEVYILYLRRKLGSSVIENVRGRGYRLNPRE